MQKAFNIQPLTEEQKQKVRDYFSTGDKGGVSESRLRFRYGRMRTEEKIQDAELYLQAKKEIEQIKYKQDKQAEMDAKLEEYRIENDEEQANYEIVRYKQREDTDTAVFGVIGIGMDGKPHRFNTHEVIQKENPEFFEECLQKYKKRAF